MRKHHTSRARSAMIPKERETTRCVYTNMHSTINRRIRSCNVQHALKQLVVALNFLCKKTTNRTQRYFIDAVVRCPRQRCCPHSNDALTHICKNKITGYLIHECQKARSKCSVKKVETSVHQQLMDACKNQANTAGLFLHFRRR